MASFLSTRLRQVFVGLMTPKDWIATFVALLALATSVYSGIATRAHDRLTARPHLHTHEQFAPSSLRVGLTAFNVGPGLAIADEFRLSLDGAPLTGDWSAQWDEFRKRAGLEGWTNRGGFLKGETIAANPSGIAEILIIIDETLVSSKDDPEKWKQRGQQLRDAVRRLTVSIEYHSVYDEHFVIEKRGLNPERFWRRGWFGRFSEWEP